MLLYISKQIKSKNQRDRMFLLGKELRLPESFVVLNHWLLETRGGGARITVGGRKGTVKG